MSDQNTAKLQLEKITAPSYDGIGHWVGGSIGLDLESRTTFRFSSPERSWVAAVLDSGGLYEQALVWPNAGVVAIGQGSTLWLLSMKDGSLQERFDFGYFMSMRLASNGSVLFIASNRGILALDESLQLLWRNDAIAADGVVIESPDDDSINVSAEWNPPGGWVQLRISCLDGTVSTPTNPGSSSKWQTH